MALAININDLLNNQKIELNHGYAPTQLCRSCDFIAQG